MSIASLIHRTKRASGLLRPHVAPRYYKLHEKIARTMRRNRNTILENHTGADPNAGNSRVAVFVHYDRRGDIHDYVHASIERLCAEGFRVRFMSNSPLLKPEAISRVRPMVASIHRRNNFGYDFGAYKDGILGALKEGTPDQLLLCNDSVYGPFKALGPILNQAAPETADVWGMTESYEMLYHLQSYFLLLHRRALENSEFQCFWQNAPYVDARGWLIYHGELGLSQALLKAGLSVRALFPTEHIAAALRRRLDHYQEMEAREETPPALDTRLHQFRVGLLDHLENGLPLNPTHFFWDILIADLGYPFIKRDLLLENPVKIPSLAEWRNLVAASGYDIELIRRHLLPRLKNRSI